MIVKELEAMGAPPLILEGGAEIDAAVSAGLSPSRQVVFYVCQWVTRQRDNDRYGR